MSDIALVDLSTAAKIVGVSHKIMQTWWAEGNIPEPSVKGGNRYFSHDDIRDIQAFKAQLEGIKPKEEVPTGPMIMMDAARFLHVPLTKLRMWALQGKIPSPVKRSRGFTWSVSDIQRIQAYMRNVESGWTKTLDNLAIEQKKPAKRMKSKGFDPLGKNPDVVWFSKSDLTLPSEYRRESSQSKVRSMASNLDWALFGALSVNARPDGTYAVYQGGRRYLAAMLREDVTEVPVVMVEGLTLGEEAQAYRLSQDLQQRISAVDRNKAQFVAGDPIAIEINDMVDQAGRKVGKSTDPATFAAVTALRKLLINHPEAVRSVWGTYTSVCEGKGMPAKLLQAMTYAESKLPPEQSIGASATKFNVLNVGYDKLLESIEAAVKLYGKRTPDVMAQGVVLAVNKGLSKPVLTLIQPE